MEAIWQTFSACHPLPPLAGQCICVYVHPCLFPSSLKDMASLLPPLSHFATKLSSFSNIFDLSFHCYILSPHSSTLAWKIPWMEEPGRLQSMGSLRVGHDWATSLSLFTFMHWRRKWQPTPVFLPGESQGWGNTVGCRLCGRTELDMTEVT